jgi:gamma-glutamylcyclotransferase (GGCT)/AIG2-like uncharacterized protein YtfP
MSLVQLPIFVYGTLQRGEERAPLWPRQPTHIEWATVAGYLFDLGPYPGLVPGSHRVLGELWHIAASELSLTLEVLDRVEGFRQPGQDDWYVREIVECHTQQGRVQQAYAYCYARPQELTGARQVQPDQRGLVHWHRYRGELH